jgi:glycosyltransferase involved in cell wall biosynthesis
LTHRILHIIPTLDRAGAEKQLALLVAGLPRERFEPHVCCLTRGGPLEADLRAAGIPVTIIGKRWKADPLAYVRLKQHIRSLQPALVHSWLFAANAYGRAAALACGVPKIVAGERCADFWKSGWQFTIDRRLARRTDRIIVNSTGTREFYIRHRLPEQKFVTIPNGVPPAGSTDCSRAAMLAEFKLPDDARVVGVVGRLWPQKRVKDLIWAADLLHLMQTNLRVLILGDGPQRRMLERFTALIGGEDFVRIVGHREDAARFIPHFDVLWNGSEYEGQSNAVLEAMAAGVPVVASDIPGNRELVVDNETGFLQPVGSRAGFTSSTDRLLQDAELARRLGEAARRRTAEQFSVEKLIERHVSLYEDLLGT